MLGCGTQVLSPGDLLTFDGDDDGYAELAISVIRRAVADLSLDALEPKWMGSRWDAYQFLTHRLWEPGCLWADLVSQDLPKDRVLELVDRLCPTGVAPCFDLEVL